MTPASSLASLRSPRVEGTRAAGSERRPAATIDIALGKSPPLQLEIVQGAATVTLPAPLPAESAGSFANRCAKELTYAAGPTAIRLNGRRWTAASGWTGEATETYVTATAARRAVTEAMEKAWELALAEATRVMPMARRDGAALPPVNVQVVIPEESLKVAVTVNMVPSSLEFERDRQGLIVGVVPKPAKSVT